MRIINVRCEYLKNPIGIDIKHPRITWSLEDGEYQKGFKIHYKVNDEEIVTNLIETQSMNYAFTDDFKSRDIIE